ncbi:uncharacterized protein PFL1_03394 [Pseudozyma flocculosa PF-1]|uniref:Related to RAV1 - Regulator of (H+)-ATPase in vacuolar membrane n=2 Tax=Pseudozyma flocculosa TaxID=84751 RepID=A0A5C3F9P4_9BASI|nr:uncharacterized protein PFL1_03394 [Pseudozyma flocculosa PF-1]EPQ29105.1 hypothetical protein PFL1_03394 [Pseudozyma flocculosa PF-1]SPO40099.1 related to RAV1 - Regulator of (H+)-ATPase in vacuolar membrane [Pseudozyma flocculosa]
MSDPTPLLRRSWTCLGQPSALRPASPGPQVPSQCSVPLSVSAALLHATAFSRGLDQRDVVTALASSDQVCLLSRDRDFVQALPFWQAFSASEETERAVTCVCVGVDPGARQTLVAAAMDHRIAIWAASNSTTRKWKVHSTVMVNDGPVTSIDLHAEMLVIGTATSISLWQLGQSGISIWRRTWSRPSPAPIRLARFSPEGSSIAAATEGGQNILLWSLPHSAASAGASGEKGIPSLTQRIFHPFPVSSFVWRHPPDPSSQSDVLVSSCADGVTRVWAAVIDEPAKLRLWATLDSTSDVGKRLAELRRASTTATIEPVPFYLEAHVVANALRANIGALEKELQMMELGLGDSEGEDDHSAQGKRRDTEMETDIKRTRLRRLQQLLSDAPDLFVKLEEDGFLTVLAVANIDRKPPTLLQTLTVLKAPIRLPLKTADVLDVALLPRYAGNGASSEDAFAVLQIRSTSGAAVAVDLNPALFFDGRGIGLSHQGEDLASFPFAASDNVARVDTRSPVIAHCSRIARLDRSADGRFLASASSTETIVWDGEAGSHQRLGKGRAVMRPSSGPYDGKSKQAAISDDGLLHARICGNELCVVAPHLLAESASCTSALPEDVEVLRFARIGEVQHLVACAKDGASRVWKVQMGDSLNVDAVARPRIPLQEEVGASVVVSIIGLGQQATTSSALVSTLSADGHLQRWGLRPTKATAMRKAPSDLSLGWFRESSMRVSARHAVLASCTSAGQNAIVSSLPDGLQRLSIYNSKASSFASGLEHERTYDAGDPILAMDWSPSPLTESTLALAFQHRVEVLAPARTAIDVGDDDGVTHVGQRWSICLRIDMASCTPSKIRGLAWLSRERIAVASASSIFVWGPMCEPAPADAKMATKASVSSAVSAAAVRQRPTHLAEVIAERTGPLPQYHPSFLQECLLWNNLDAAKAIIINLRAAIAAVSPGSIEETWHFKEISLDAFSLVDAGNSGAARNAAVNGQAKARPNGRSIFDDDGGFASDGTDDATSFFGTKGAQSLLRAIDGIHVPHLSDNDVKALAVIIRTLGEAEEQRRSLDDNGLRFLMSLRLLLNRPENELVAEGALAGELDHQDTVWAQHSNNQEPLLSAIAAGCGGKLTWAVARSTGVFMWLKSQTALREQAEQVARAQFMVGDDRDPVKCSLLYYALGKPKVVLGLWKQAIWHPEQKKMLQFLAKDFSEERWRTAAQKNAFALLSQRRYEFAASFFLLGGSLQDAVNVCVRNLGDLNLAVALARIYEGGDDGPVLRNLLQTKVLPQVFANGQRWLGSWAFWMLKRRDLAVRIIVSPLSELMADPDVAAMLPSDAICGEGHSDDPSLAILLKQLKNKSLQTLKGTAAISERKEFDFVLHANRVLCRMGCHLLGLNLLRTWEFEPPPTVASSTASYHAVSKQDLVNLSRVGQDIAAAVDQDGRSGRDDSRDGFAGYTVSLDVETSTSAPRERTAHQRRESYASSMSPPPSPTMSRRRSSMLRRRSSIVNDLDIGSFAGAIGSASLENAAHQRQSASDSSDGAVASSTKSREASAASAPSTMFQHRACDNATITEEPTTVDEEERSATIETPSQKQVDDAAAAAANESKPKGLSVFKSAAASNASQGAQEFDFGSFGF